MQLQLKRSIKIRKPNPKYTNAAVVEVEIPKEPETFEEASLSPKWIKAVEEEITTLKQNQTWELVPKPKEAKPIPCK